MDATVRTSITPPPGKVATAQELHHFMSLTSIEAIRNPTE